MHDLNIRLLKENQMDLRKLPSVLQGRRREGNDKKKKLTDWQGKWEGLTFFPRRKQKEETRAKKRRYVKRYVYYTDTGTRVHQAENHIQVHGPETPGCKRQRSVFNLTRGKKVNDSYTGHTLIRSKKMEPRRQCISTFKC